MNSRVFVAATAAMFSFLAVSPREVQAAAISYEMTFTLNGCNGGCDEPDAVVFTYDPDTEVFDDLNILWSSSTDAILFSFVGACICYINVNNWSSLEKQAFLSDLLDGGRWTTATTLQGIDAWIDLDGVFFYSLSAGNNQGDWATGSFTTTIVSEPPTLTLSVAGLLVFMSALVPRRVKQFRAQYLSISPHN